MMLLEEYNIEIHDELNPRIWDGDELRPRIKQGVLRVVDEFQDYIGYQLPIVDIVLVGSNASYNYTEHSDLDVHLILNFENIDDNKELVNMLCQGWKSSFNSAYDIQLGGQDVELYCEDMMTSTNSNGIYSVLQDRWLKYPQPIEIPKDSIDIESFVQPVKVEAEDVLNFGSLEDVEKMIDWLYYQRKLALQTDGEFSVGNLVFKTIRNEGLLDKLKDRRYELKSKELTVEKLDCDIE